MTGSDASSPGADLVALVVAAAAALRAGADPARAWSEVLGVPVGSGGAPSEEQLIAVLRGAAARSRWAVRRRARRTLDPAVLRSVAVVVAATRLALVLGAPLALVLDRCATTLEVERDTAADVEAVLAGPRQTADLLGWLPLVGLVLGVLLGADPLAVLLDGRWGTTAGAAGAALTLAGRRWVRRLVRGARVAGGL